jgi:transcriptional regulator of NAD metabolism
MNELEYKDLILKQNTNNCHYMIFDKKTNEMLMHCSYNKKLTEDEMKKAIDRLYLIREHIIDDAIYGKGKTPKGILESCDKS